MTGMKEVATTVVTVATNALVMQTRSVVVVPNASSCSTILG
jgi:hypothetical protein